VIREFQIDCPSCKGWILIDLETGEILKHGKAGQKRGDAPAGKSLDAVLGEVRDRDKRGDDTFADAVRSVEAQKKRLEKAFEDAKKKARENPDERPPNPMDEKYR
jgi:hypothetical protein